MAYLGTILTGNEDQSDLVPSILHCEFELQNLSAFFISLSHSHADTF